jgi:hypothetical protein
MSVFDSLENFLDPLFSMFDGGEPKVEQTAFPPGTNLDNAVTRKAIEDADLAKARLAQKTQEFDDLKKSLTAQSSTDVMAGLVQQAAEDIHKRNEGTRVVSLLEILSIIKEGRVSALSKNGLFLGRLIDLKTSRDAVIGRNKITAVVDSERPGDTLYEYSAPNLEMLFHNYEFLYPQLAQGVCHLTYSTRYGKMLPDYLPEDPETQNKEYVDNVIQNYLGEIDNLRRRNGEQSFLLKKNERRVNELEEQLRLMESAFDQNSIDNSVVRRMAGDALKALSVEASDKDKLLVGKQIDNAKIELLNQQFGKLLSDVESHQESTRDAALLSNLLQLKEALRPLEPEKQPSQQPAAPQAPPANYSQQQYQGG